MKNVFPVLLIMLIGRLAFGQITQWTFNSGADGWVLTHSLTGTVGGGVYDVTITGADPYMLSPDFLYVDAVAMGKIKIRLQNISADSQFQLFWTTTTDNVWDQKKSVLFSVHANDTAQTDYTLTMLGNTQWSGTIKQLRLDLGNVNTSGNVKIDEIDILPLEFGLDNGILHLRLDLSRGGAISYISQSSVNRSLVNIYDEGRYIQQSYYAGKTVNRQASGQNPNWSPWNWNPIQVGDSYFNRAQLLNYQQYADSLYVKCIPMQWDMKNMPAEAEMEQWTILTNNVIHVKNRLTCHRTDTIYGEGISNYQELPATYIISALKNLYTYFGNAPFTNAPVVSTPVVNLASGFWGVYLNDTVTESWMAFVDDTLWGMAVYNPLSKNFFAGMAGTPGHEFNSSSTSYIAPSKTVALNKNSVFEYEYYLIVGKLNELRSLIYTIHADSLFTSSGQPEKDPEVVSIHPNPAHGFVNIRWKNVYKGNGKLELFNMHNQLLLSDNINLSNYQLNISSFSKGLYFIRITNGTQVINRKLLIE